MAGRAEDRRPNQQAVQKATAQTPGSFANRPPLTAENGPATGGGQRMGGQANDPMSRMGDQAAGAVDKVTTQGGQMASSLAGQARQQATTRLHDQKERASAGLESAAEALRQTSQHMREQDQIGVSQYADQAAMQLERVANYLHRHDVSDLVSEVEAFARQRPALFLGAAFGLGFLATRFLKSSEQGGGMPGMQGAQSSNKASWKTIEVNVPVRVAYNQWTQFEEFPNFMEGVKQVEQLSDRRLRWRAEIAGKEEQWDAVITEQVPDRRISWRNTTGARNAGTVTFYPLGPTRTRIALQIDYQPEGPIEQVGSALGLVERRIEGDLQRFREFIESRGTATGAWRGEIHGEQAQGH